jgi:hypothetical protein
MLFKKTLIVFGYLVKTFIQVKKHHGTVGGVASMCADGMHILQVDYDDISWNLMQFELRAIQKSYDVGNIYVLESSPGKYHAISFSKFNYNELRGILEQLHCDAAFKISKTILLRTSGKSDIDIKYKQTLSSNTKRESSVGHAKHYLNANILKPEHLSSISDWDGLDGVNEVKYPT